MSSRQRKGKAALSPRRDEEGNSTPVPHPRESRSSAPSRSSAAASSSSGGLQVLLWSMLVLLAGTVGALAWLHLEQRNGLRDVGQALLELRSRLPRELEGLKEQVLREQEDKISEAADIDQRVSEMEEAWKLLEQKLEKATAGVEQTLASDIVGQLSALQNEVKQSLSDIRAELPSNVDLSSLQRQLELIKSTQLEKLAKDMGEILSDHTGMKDNLTSLAAWYATTAGAAQENSRSLQDLRQDMSTVSDSLEASLDFLHERVEILEGGFNQTARTVEVLQSQLERSREDVTVLREVANSRSQDQISESQQLDNIRDMIKQLDAEKARTEEDVNAIRHNMADQKRETQSEVLVLTSALEVLQARVSQVESVASSQDGKLSEAVEQEMQSLRKGLDKVEGGIQQCKKASRKRKHVNAAICKLVKDTPACTKDLQLLGRAEHVEGQLKRKHLEVYTHGSSVVKKSKGLSHGTSGWQAADRVKKTGQTLEHFKGILKRTYSGDSKQGSSVALTPFAVPPTTRVKKTGLSGEVQTYCETEDDCGWPHLREVNFPHRVLTEPTITLGVSSLSAQGSVGVSVKAIDITDSGFKIQISNIGDHHLSSIRVTWMLCA